MRAVSITCLDSSIAPKKEMDWMSPVRMSRMEVAARLVLDYYLAFNRRDLEGMLQLITEDCLFESMSPPPDGARYTGKTATRRYWEQLVLDHPQAEFAMEEVSGFGMRCVALWQLRLGRNESVRGMDLFQVQENLICKQLSYIKGTYPQAIF